MRILRLLLRTATVSLLLSIVSEPCAAELQGKVVAVADGDTLTLLEDKTEHKVRLEGIDAPERGQPFGTAARKALSSLAFGKTARVVEKGTDRYGRTLGVVWVGQTNANLALVQMGFAWHFIKYSKDGNLAKAEAEARTAHLGLWRDKDPMPPWEWRRRKQVTP